MARYNASVIIDTKYYLVLNNITGNTESGTEFGSFETEEEAIAFYTNELCPVYGEPGESLFDGRPTTWMKSFKKDGPLEWFNPLPTHEGKVCFTPGYHGHGIHEVSKVTEIIAKTRI